MNIQTTIPISEARKKIFQIAEEVQIPSTYYTLTEKGRSKVVIMSSQEFESWQETLEVTKDFPDLKKDIKDSRCAFKSGVSKKWTTLDELLKKQGYVSNKNKTKGTKRISKTS